MRVLSKFFMLMMCYFLLAGIIFIIVDFGVETLSGFIVPTFGSIIFSLIVTTFVVFYTINMTPRVVEGNKVLLTVNLLFPKKLHDEHFDGQTKYNCYPSGFHLVWWWEKDKEAINLEADISEPFDFTVSTRDDDVRVQGQFDVAPDPNNLSVYVLNGKDPKEREKNIADRVRTSIKRSIEICLNDYDSSDILKDRDGIVSSEDGLQGYLDEVIDYESEILGIVINKVRIGNIDFSEAISKVRNDQKTVTKRAEAAEFLANRLDTKEKIEAYRRIQIDNDKVQEQVITIDAPEGFNGLFLGGGEGAMVGAGTGSKKTSKTQSKGK